MKTRKICIALLSVSLLMGACKKETPRDTFLKAEDLIDLSYGTSELNKLDVYLPEGRSDTTRVIIFLHGGSWAEGDKEELKTLSQYFRDRGFATVNANYRLTHTPDNFKLNDLSADVSLVEKYVFSNARKWHISPDKFGMLGFSAGGHLALLHTYLNNADNRIKTVVSLAAPTNFTDISGMGTEQATVLEWLLGGSLQSDYSIYAEASPITHVNTLSKPTLIFHGSSDALVPVGQSEALKSKLEQLNVKNKLVIYDGLGHEDLINDQNKDAFLLETETWFRDYIK